MSLTTANLKTALDDWARMNKRNLGYMPLYNDGTERHIDRYPYMQPPPLHWWHRLDPLLQLLYIAPCVAMIIFVLANIFG